jgi:hypothetical protein
MITRAGSALLPDYHLLSQHHQHRRQPQHPTVNLRWVHSKITTRTTDDGDPQAPERNHGPRGNHVRELSGKATASAPTAVGKLQEIRSQGDRRKPAARANPDPEG